MRVANITGFTEVKNDSKEDKKEKEKPKETYSVYKRNECHTGTVSVFKDPVSGVEICGGGRSRDIVLKQSDLLIDVGIKLDTPIQIFGLQNPLNLLNFNKVPSIIKIDWSDMGVPDLPKSFWKELIKVIRAEKKRVVISCLGGHGRTGTALSILAVMMGITKTDPVKFIREKYCKEAVESNSQLDYIEEMTGIKVEEKGAKSYTTTYTYPNYEWKDRWIETYGNKKDEKNVDKVTEKFLWNNLSDLDKAYF